MDLYIDGQGKCTIFADFRVFALSTGKTVSIIRWTGVTPAFWVVVEVRKIRNDPIVDEIV